MVYGPMIESATLRERVPLGEEHLALLYDEVVSAGSVQYHFVVVVFEHDAEAPCLFVTSEVNAMASELGGGSHFLCVFEDETHFNLGDDDAWSDQERFFPESLRVAAERLGIES